jgi:hypothetical protein
MLVHTHKRLAKRDTPLETPKFSVIQVQAKQKEDKVNQSSLKVS